MARSAIEPPGYLLMCNGDKLYMIQALYETLHIRHQLFMSIGVSTSVKTK